MYCKNMRLLFDVDGTVADFHRGLVRVANEKIGRRFTYEQSLAYRRAEVGLDLTEEENEIVYREVHGPGFADSLDPIEGAVETIKRLYDSGSHSILFVTSPAEDSITWMQDRDRWLQRVFGEDLGSRVIYTDHKYAVDGDVIVEDTPSYGENWLKDSARRPDARAFIYAWPYNKTTPLPRFHHWNEFIPMLERLRETA